MADLKLRAKSEGLDRIEREFDGLTKAQQRNLLKTSAVGKEFANMEKRAVGAIKRTEAATQQGQATTSKFGDSLKGLVGGFTAVGVAGGLAFKGVAAVIKQAEENAQNLRRVLRESTDASAQKGSSAGSILLNAGDLAQNPDEARRVVNQLDTLAIQRGRTGAELGDAFANIRPATGGATDDQRVQALDIAFKGKQVNEGFDAPGFAAAIIKIAQSNERRGEGFDLQKAADQLLAIADKAGLDTNQIGQPVSQLIGAETTGASIQQLGGALAFYTAKTQKTGESGVEAILPLITKLAAEDKVKIAGKNVTLEGADPFAKLTNFAERLNKGEFGDNKTRAISDLTTGGGGVNTQLLVGQITSDLQGFTESLAAGATGGVGINQRFEAKRQLDLTFDEGVRSNEAKARTFAASATDVRSARIELQARQLEDLLRQSGADPSTSGGFRGELEDLFTLGVENRSERFRKELNEGASVDDLRIEELQNAFSRQYSERVDDPLPSLSNAVGDEAKRALALGNEREAARLQILPGARGQFPELRNLQDAAQLIGGSNGIQRSEQFVAELAGIGRDILTTLQLPADERAKISPERTTEILTELKDVLSRDAAEARGQTLNSQSASAQESR